MPVRWAFQLFNRRFHRLSPSRCPTSLCQVKKILDNLWSDPYPTASMYTLSSPDMWTERPVQLNGLKGGISTMAAKKKAAAKKGAKKKK